MGVFIILIFIIGYSIKTFKESSWNNENRNESIMGGKPYYMDSRGRYRRVDNGHEVLTYTIDFKTGDRVDLDLKTNQILRNYSQEERDKELAKENNYKDENKKRKEKAILEGRIYYTSYEKVKIYENKYDYKYVTRRISDDLELEEIPRRKIPMKDKRCGFILWRHPGEYEATWNDESLEKDKALNWEKIKSKFWQDHLGMTEEELEAYARKIDALL